MEYRRTDFQADKVRSSSLDHLLMILSPADPALSFVHLLVSAPRPTCAPVTALSTIPQPSIDRADHRAHHSQSALSPSSAAHLVIDPLNSSIHAVCPPVRARKRAMSPATRASAHSRYTVLSSCLRATTYVQRDSYTHTASMLRTLAAPAGYMSYGDRKAGLNWIARRIHFENASLSG
ncbi:hypothetical protein HYPSUDRAFT_209974 [Hypholoma sublateritium FD-334 SS-4]|uniref:Uncharacterized protein n=1 Tax=Hypholoma sublateritium (strain FD-334 SS-4) TaxID=945553 RepID=A0A0D2NWL0_HYPSF|nr:hypothetical protein HYPSUDRAFT_209974 [Hypholoma sublateritium FD-334 SS-4]